MHHRFGVVAHIVGLQSVVLGVLHIVKYLGRTQECLCRYAAPIQANPAEIIAFDDRRFEAELRRPNCGDIPAGPGTDDQDVEGSVGHTLIRLRRGPIECNSN